MKGNNTLYLNHATMIEAMQLWLDHQFKSAPKAKLLKSKIEDARTVWCLDIETESDPAGNLGSMK